MNVVITLSPAGDRVIVASDLPVLDVLDWFHVTMRLIVLGQMAKGLPRDIEALNDVPERLERAKHHLWHGHVGQGCAELSDLEMDLSSALDRSQVDPTCFQKMKKYVVEMIGYIGNNKAYMVNYGERYRAGERISTGFANRRSIRSSANALSSSSRCAGHRAVPTCYFRSGPGYSTTNLRTYSASGIQPSGTQLSPRILVASTVNVRYDPETHEVRIALPDTLDGTLFGAGDYTLEVLRGKTSRVKLREHDAEAMEGHRQAEEDRAAEETLTELLG